MSSERPKLSLTFGSDRSLMCEQGGSVRYLVAALSAEGGMRNVAGTTPLNLALAVDVSGSMSGQKIEAARATAMAVVQALRPTDRLSIVAFSQSAHLLLDASLMDAFGRSKAIAAIERLQVQGSTALFAGWELATSRVLAAQQADARASHRVILITDGQANVGPKHPRHLAQSCADAQLEGIITSAVGIGEGYDESLLAAMTEAGGGRLHDATAATEIGEVVLGEILEGRRALVERAVLRVSITGAVRAEVVGPWRATELMGTLAVQVGSLAPDQTKRVVIRVFCPQGFMGDSVRATALLEARMPDDSASLHSSEVDVQLSFAEGRANSAQARDYELSLVALKAWQSDVMRRALEMNQQHDWHGAQHYMQREFSLMARYAEGLPGAFDTMEELELLAQQIARPMHERTRKDVYVARMKSSRGEMELRQDPLPSVKEMLRRPPR